MHTFDSVVRLIVVVRVVICSHQQSFSLLYSLRVRILLDITSQHVDSLIEQTIIQLILQLGIVEECILGNSLIVITRRRHSKRVKGIRLVAELHITICQVICGILCQHIIGTARLTQELLRLIIDGLAIERIAENIILHSAHLAARVTIIVDISHSIGIITQLEIRFCHYTANLDCILLNALLNKCITLRYYLLVLPILKVELKQVVWHQLTILRRVSKRLKAFTCRRHIALGIRHI